MLFFKAFVEIPENSPLISFYTGPAQGVIRKANRTRSGVETGGVGGVTPRAVQGRLANGDGEVQGEPYVKA